MKKTYLIIDTNHLLHRTRHVTRGDIWTQTGLSFHIIFESIKNCWQKFKADHVVFCLEGRSWRYALYEPYKKNRQYHNNLKSAQEVENDEFFFSAVNDLLGYLDKQTNCTVLQNEIAEADDLIARFIHLHPDSNHIIISGDTDFIQLLAPNVSIYDGINKRTLTLGGIFNEKNQRVEFQVKSEGKLKIMKPNEDFKPDPEWTKWALFLKIIRGDTNDNIFSAYPKIRSTQIKKVFDDRINEGFEWNNFMLSRWIDHNNKENQVKACYERNKLLIDLTKQPEEVKEIIDESILNTIGSRRENQNIGTYFLKFAGKYELKRIADSSRTKLFLDFLSAKYE